jgi:hypothetical protein
MMQLLFKRKREKADEGREEEVKKLATKEEPSLGLKVLYEISDDSKTIVE